MPKKSKRDIKANAQDELLYALLVPFYKVADGHLFMDDEEVAEMRKQRDRVARLFGYDKYPFK